MKNLVRLLALAILMAGCAPGTTFPLLIPTPLPPDEDCSNFLSGVWTYRKWMSSSCQ